MNFFRLPALVSSLVFTALLAGCNSGDSADSKASAAPPVAVHPIGVVPPEKVTTPPVCVVDSFRQPTNPVSNKLDVLFVMDNSRSMNRHWQLMARSIGKLIREMPAGQDIRFSVILGSLTIFDGELFSAPRVPKVLDLKKLTEAQIVNYLQQTFAYAVELKNVDPKGVGEALFYSLYDAVTGKARANQKLGFFRPDAALSVIFMSDDAEEGFPYPSQQPWNLPPKCNYIHHETMRKTFYVPHGVNVDSTFAAMKRLKGDMPLLTSAFVNITKEDILVDNSMDAKCIYDSPGYGYFDMVKRTNGVLYSIHQNRGDGMQLVGRELRARVDLLHDFKLSKPAAQVDPATIEADVDNQKTAFTYSADTNVVHIDQAGGPGSAIDIHHCEPAPKPDWTLTDFTGETTQTTASLSFNTREYATSGKVVYGLAPDALNDTAADSQVSTAHAVGVTGLLPNTKYYFQAVAHDEFGTEKRSGVISLQTFPDWSLSPLVGQASRTTATLSWDTASYPTVGFVRWGTSPDQLSNRTPDTASLKSHTVGVEGLSPSTDYYFQAVSTDDFGVSRSSEVAHLRTADDWGIVGFTGEASRTTASLVWQTPEEVTTGQLFYGLSADALTQVANSAVGNLHSVSLANLAPGTTYYFQASSKDQTGQEKRSAVISLKTLNDWTLAGFSGWATTDTVTASFTTAGYPTNGRILWGTSADSLPNSVDAAANSETHEAAITGLTPDTDYYLQAVASDSLGVVRTSAVIRVHTNAVVVPLPTWTIAGFDGSATVNTATLVWHTSDYPTLGKLFWGTSPGALNQEVDETVAAKDHSVPVTGLNADTVYYFQAVATDDRGQTQSSSVIAVRTQAVPLPNWSITGFTGTSTQTSVNLTWNTSEYATQAKVFWGTTASNLTNEVDEATSGTAHNLPVNGLTPNTIYFFQVVAHDDRGQEKSSAVIAVRTEAVPEPTPTPTPTPTPEPTPTPTPTPTPVPTPTWQVTGFDGTSTSTQVNLIWQTPGANTRATVNVGLSANDLSFRSVAVDTYAASHVIAIAGLTPGTTYYFQVVAEDQNGGVVTSNTISKTTKTR